LRMANDGVRLIAITGYGGSEARERARKSGIEQYLVKPIEASELERLLL
jgi:CheY-like chemotaxis protein